MEAPADTAPLGITALGPVPSERKARDHALVLQSMSVWHMLRPGLGGWVVLVRDRDYDRAARAIDRYEEENRNWPPIRTRERLRYAATPIAAIVFAAMIGFFLVTGEAADRSAWFYQGRSASDLVLGPEPFRAVTALTLHADGPHVMGNAISGTIFGTAVSRRLGAGGGMLAILLSGALGNFVNAAYHHSQGDLHLSIGASTAVLGAVGILASTQVFALHRRPEGKTLGLVQLIAPLVGGLALLGAIGASPESDLGAHGFGFLAGCAVGLVASLLQRSDRPGPSDDRRQVVLGALALGLVIGSWQLAMAA